jgi:hypothetical protein
MRNVLRFSSRAILTCFFAKNRSNFLFQSIDNSRHLDSAVDSHTNSLCVLCEINVNSFMLSIIGITRSTCTEARSCSE